MHFHVKKKEIKNISFWDNLTVLKHYIFEYYCAADVLFTQHRFVTMRNCCLARCREALSNKANVTMQAVNLWTVKDLTKRKKRSPEVEEDKMWRSWCSWRSWWSWRSRCSRCSCCSWRSLCSWRSRRSRCSWLFLAFSAFLVFSVFSAFLAFLVFSVFSTVSLTRTLAPYISLQIAVGQKALSQSLFQSCYFLKTYSFSFDLAEGPFNKLEFVLAVMHSANSKICSLIQQTFSLTKTFLQLIQKKVVSWSLFWSCCVLSFCRCYHCFSIQCIYNFSLARIKMSIGVSFGHVAFFKSKDFLLNITDGPFKTNLP